LSVVAETSKTAVEIYQPVIVGLGVVALTFVANVLLEWWRAFLERRRDIAVLRRAIVIELIDICDVLPNVIDGFENSVAKNGQVAISVSRWLVSCDREKLGSLSKQEAEKIAKVVSKMKRAMSMSEVHNDKYVFGEHHFLQVNLENPEMMQTMKDFLERYRIAASDALELISQNVRV